MKLSRIAAATVLAAVCGTTWAAPASAATATATPSAPKVSQSFALPNVSKGFAPQGTMTWKTYTVIAEYKASNNTRLVAVDAKGKVYGTVSIAETHAGGIATVGAWTYVEAQPTDGSDTILRYSTSAFNTAMTASHKSGKPVYLKSVGSQKMPSWVFMSAATTDGTYLYVAHHGVGAGSRAYKLGVNQASGLLTVVSYVMTPDMVQGLALLNGALIYSVGGGHLVIGDQSITVGSHSEGITVRNGVVTVVFEAGVTHAKVVQL